MKNKNTVKVVKSPIIKLVERAEKITDERIVLIRDTREMLKKDPELKSYCNPEFLRKIQYFAGDITAFRIAKEINQANYRKIMAHNEDNIIAMESAVSK